jgi:signal transduction histidine kinase
MNPAAPAQKSQPLPRLGIIGAIVLYLVFAAVLARTLAIDSLRPRLLTYLAAEALFLFLYTVVLFIPHLPGWLLHPYFFLQSGLIVWLISLYPDFDFLILLYLLLSAQVSLVFSGRTMWAWIGAFMLFSAASLIYFHGLAGGLALSLTTIAAELVVPAYFIVTCKNEIARRQSQALLGELQDTNQRLQAYASQAEDLAALQERNRLARELHDTVSQLIFSISLTTRSAQMLLKTDPARLSEQLERIQSMTADALAQLRSLISRLRPPEND